LSEIHIFQRGASLADNNRRTILVGVIGAGEGASFLLEILRDNPEVRIAGLAYRSENRWAVMEAWSQGIALYSDFRKLVENDDIEMLVDVTGNPAVEDYLREGEKTKSQLLSPLGAMLLWRLLDEQKKMEREMAKNLAEQEVLYSAGVMLASAANTKQTLDLIMESALSITGMTAGTLALYDEEKGIMQIKASVGLNKVGMPENYEWELRPGGLTGHILSNSHPTVITDLKNEKAFDTSRLERIGVRSLIATPLKVSGKIVGILYVDDFSPREFSDREKNILSLLALQAAAAIDKAILLEKAEFMAVTDGLTKLYNHRYFVRTLEKEIRRAERYNYSTTLCMIDVDYFKNYNDTFGHQRGNHVLTTLANLLRLSARDTDIVARYGGEEFAIIFTQANLKQARDVSERIRKEVYETVIQGEEKQPGGKLTVSMGLATYPEDTLTPVNLIEYADRALYVSKKMGRNRITNFSDIADMTS